MKNYHVQYEIDVTADSPEAAALIVERYMKDAGSYRPVLDVTDENGETTRIDLEELEVSDETTEPEPAPEMVKVYDLKSDKELHFDRHTDPVYAVRYAHVTEDQPELSSWFFAAIQDRKQDEIELKLPVTKTANTVCCGDWVTKR